MKTEKKKAFDKILNIYTFFGLIFVLLAILLFLIPITPYVIYRIQPSKTEEELEKIVADLGEYEEEVEPEAEDILEDDTDENPIDPSLPEQNYISIPKISVYSPIEGGTNYVDALKEGTWIVPNFGIPEKNEKPIILAAHRFGYVYWDRGTRKTVSFANLPETKVGDRVEIIWGQRKYIYKIYKAEESTYISDYSADLILYTCKYFSSPERIFRYANRVIEE